MRGSAVATGTVTPPVRDRYEYECIYNPARQMPRKKSPANESPLNLLSSAASTVVSKLSSSPGSPTRSTLSKIEIPRGHPTPPFLVDPTAVAMVPNMPQRTVSNIPTVPTQPPANSPRSPVSILSVFPRIPPSASAHSLPMPPGMEITFSLPDSTPPSHKKKDREDLSIKKGEKKAHPIVKPKTKSKYKMKYHYISMRRWEAYRYIDALSRGSMHRNHHSPVLTNYGYLPAGTSNLSIPGYMSPPTASYSPAATSVTTPSVVLP